MEPDKTDAPEVPETQEVAEETTKETPEEKPQDEEKDKLKKQLEESESKRKQLFERLKEKETEVPSQKEEDFSNKDILALVKADVAEEDMDEVIEFAKFKKLTVSEALKNQTLKSILSDKASERKTAAATQVRGGARGTSKVSGEDLLLKAERTGEIPDDDEGMQAIFKARLARKFPQRK